ncbi:hypothetical protein C1645_748387 [Glomus cerebriforme]|uniref:Uncharacterized protein n=1 Tax=Glomus cerebriforme TaxID=658196 RepID=A0A397TW10_9GLOM|nr:hypothetical protein C1645_748387 [Glomus cerebriforme]
MNAIKVCQSICGLCVYVCMFYSCSYWFKISDILLYTTTSFVFICFIIIYLLFYYYYNLPYLQLYNENMIQAF